MSGQMPAGAVGADGSTPSDAPDVGSVSVGQLMSEVVSDLSTLMRQEVELAKAEMRQEATKAVRGAALMGAAAVAALLFLLLLSLALVWWLDDAWPLPAAAATVAAVWAVVGAAAFLSGRAQLREVDPKPEQTIESLTSIKEDAPWVSNRSS